MYRGLRHRTASYILIIICIEAFDTGLYPLNRKILIVCSRNKWSPLPGLCGSSGRRCWKCQELFKAQIKLSFDFFKRIWIKRCILLMYMYRGLRHRTTSFKQENYHCALMQLSGRRGWKCRELSGQVKLPLVFGANRVQKVLANCRKWFVKKPASNNTQHT
jgi:hypothetical protein